MWAPEAVWMADGVMHKMRIISKLPSSARIVMIILMIMMMDDNDDEDNQQNDLIYKFLSYYSIAMMMAMRLN